MIVEIGHFYTNEIFDQKSLKYLETQRFSKDDVLCLFIDNFTCESNLLDVDLLRKSCEEIVGRKVHVFYESLMQYFFKGALEVLDKSKIERVSINRKPTEIRFGGRKIFDCITKRPTCQMLSFTWTLFRLGFFGNVPDVDRDGKPILTVIDKKYMKLENRVFEMVPPEYRNRIFYRFF